MSSHNLPHRPFRHPELPVSYLPLRSNPSLVRYANSLSPHLSCYPSKKSRLEGGRIIYVDLLYEVKPDSELYMTEYAAIRIVFTLQGLYTCTHSPRHQPTRRPTDSEAPVNEANGYGTILLPVWGVSSRRRSPGAVKLSRMESPWILRSGAIGSYPLPLTLKHYPPAVMVPRIASSGWVPPHKG